MAYTLSYQQLEEMGACVPDLGVFRRIFGLEPVEWNMANLLKAACSRLDIQWLYDGWEYARTMFFMRDTIIALGFNTDQIDMRYALFREEYWGVYRMAGFPLEEYRRRVFDYMLANPPERLRKLAEKQDE